MSIQHQCEKCRKLIQLQEKWIGKQLQCPSCGHRFVFSNKPKTKPQQPSHPESKSQKPKPLSDESELKLINDEEEGYGSYSSGQPIHDNAHTTNKPSTPRQKSPPPLPAKKSKPSTSNLDSIIEGEPEADDNILNWDAIQQDAAHSTIELDPSDIHASSSRIEDDPNAPKQTTMKPQGSRMIRYDSQPYSGPAFLDGDILGMIFWGGLVMGYIAILLGTMPYDGITGKHITYSAIAYVIVLAIVLIVAIPLTFLPLALIANMFRVSLPSDAFYRTYVNASFWAIIGSFMAIADCFLTENNSDSLLLLLIVICIPLGIVWMKSLYQISFYQVFLLGIGIALIYAMFYFLADSIMSRSSHFAYLRNNREQKIPSVLTQPLVTSPRNQSPSVTRSHRPIPDYVPPHVVVPIDTYDKAVDYLQRTEASDRYRAMDYLHSIEVNAISDEQRTEMTTLMLNHMNDPNSSISRKAMEWILRWEPEKAIPELMFRLSSNSSTKRRQAITTLASMKHEPAIQPISLLLSKESNEAMAAMIRFGDPAEKYVIDQLGKGDFRIKRSALEVLNHIGTNKCLEAVKLAARDRDDDVAEQARQLWRKLEPETFTTLDEVILILETDSFSSDREKVLPVLDKLKPTEESRKKLAPILTQMYLDDHTPSPVLKRVLVKWHNQETINELRQLLQTKYTSTSKAKNAIKLLGQIGDESAAIDIIRWVIKQPLVVGEALINIGPACEDDILVALKTAKSNQAKIIACVVLEKIGTRKSLSTLFYLSERSKDLLLRKTAKQAHTQVMIRFKASKQTKKNESP